MGLIGWLLNPDYGGCLVPQLVQLIIFPLKGSEDVDNNVAIVEEEPSGIYGPLAMVGYNGCLL